MAFTNVVKYTVCTLRHVKCRLFVRSLGTNIINMKIDGLPRTAYFQKNDSDSTLYVSILIDHDPLNMNRNFTFCRKIDSTVSSLLARIDLRIKGYMEKKLKKRSLNYTLPSIESRLYKNGEPVSQDMPCSCLFLKKDKYGMKILGDFYEIVCNAPWINNFGLPKKILSNSVIYPLKFDANFMDKEISTFKWYRSKNIAAYLKTNIVHVKEWDEVGNKICYAVQDDDVGHYLKLVCIPQNQTAVGPTFTIIALSPVAASKNNYNFVKTHILTEEKTDDSKIRIVSYNLLADSYVCTKEAKTIFDYCSPDVLQKEIRYAALVTEIFGYNADLVCLQEVDRSMHYSYLMGRLEHEGYDGILCSKANDIEGTACYYNKQKFSLISSEKFMYAQEITTNTFLKDIYFYLQQNKDMYSKFCDLPHCLQLVVLQHTRRQEHLVLLGNLHLFSQADAGLIRLLQGIISFKIYEFVLNKLQEEKPNHKISFILCGDFNSTPECSLNELVMKGFISSEHPIWTSEKMKGLSYKLPINMASAFPDVKYTNYTRLFKGCLDYMYYQSDFLEVTKTYPLPDEDELSNYIGLPSPEFPSDHLPLIAEMQWKT